MCAAWVIGLYLGQRWGEGGGGGRGGEAMNAYIINKEEGERMKGWRGESSPLVYTQLRRR